jgi:hypothetical protein
LIGATVIGFGAGFVGLKSQQATVLKVRQKLIVTLAAEAIFGGGGGNVYSQALTFDEHEEALGHFIGDRDGQGAGRANELMGGGIELESVTHGNSVGVGGKLCLIEYGSPQKANWRPAVPRAGFRGIRAA